MIKARHTYLGNFLGEFYSGFVLDRAFHSIKFIGSTEDKGLPVLLISNHFSWWDGFIQYRLNNRFYRRKYHVMMLEEQLKKYMILNQAGAFSICKESRDLIESLSYSVDLLNDKKNMVVLFPQGKIESLYTTEFLFGTGVNYILTHLPYPVQLIFNVNLIDYYSNKKPSLYVYMQEYEYQQKSRFNLSAEFSCFAEKCRLKQ